MSHTQTSFDEHTTWADHVHHALLRQEIMDEMEREMIALEFPKDKKKIAALSHDTKMRWYAGQFQKDPQAATIMLSTKEFESFWKWRVMIPLRIKRMYFRIKNFEVFKKYPHISEMKKKVKPYSV